MIEKFLPVALVLFLTAGALFIRLQGLRGADGDLDQDEARLALAAQGVLATGLPKLPSGRIYTRGAISAYVMAPSLWLFGPHDFAARLPSALAGTLLIPTVYALGRAVAGPTGGLCTAAFVALQPQLIFWSDKAWMPSLFVLVFVGAAYLLYLGYGQDRSSMQLAGAASFVIAIFVHELAIVLPMAVLATLATRAARRDFDWFTGRKSVVALLSLGFGLLLFVVLAILLRMGTIAGPGSEFSAYFKPSLTLAGLEYYYDHLARGYPLLLAAAALGIPLVLRVPGAGMLFLYMAMAAAIVTPGFLLHKYSERYGIMLLPLLGILAAWALAEGMRFVGSWWKDRRSAPAALSSIVLVIAFGLSLGKDLFAVTRSAEPFPGTWLAAFQALGPAPEDLVMSDAPTVIAFYRGRVDYWARIEGERYAYVANGDVRELYTGAVRVRNEREFQGLADANAGRRLWYVGEVRQFSSDRYVDPALRARLLRTAQIATTTPDRWVIMRIDLGARAMGQR